MQIEKGDILLAEPFMKDASFKRSVIIICDHNEDGAFGLVLNKRTDYKVAEVIDFPDFDADLYNGGPVSPDTLHYIHKYGDLIEGSIPLKGDIAWGGDFGQIKLMAEKGLIHPSGIRFFVGYSGWGSGQLESEMKENSWIIAREFDNIFNNDHELWKRVLFTLGGQYPLMANYPEDPTLN